MAVRILAVKVAILGSELTIVDLFSLNFFTHRVSPSPLQIGPPEKPYELSRALIDGEIRYV